MTIPGQPALTLTTPNTFENVMFVQMRKTAPLMFMNINGAVFLICTNMTFSNVFGVVNVRAGWPGMVNFF